MLNKNIEAEKLFAKELANTKVLPDKKNPHYNIDYNYIVTRINTGNELANSLLHTYPSINNGTMLDLGVGSGGISVSFSKLNFNVKGLDVNKDYLDLAKKRSEYHKTKLELKEWDGVNIPYDSETFSLVLIMDILEHVPDPHQLIKEICRVLKPGGICFFCTENKYSPVFLIGDPHYGIPLLTLFPRFIRNFIIVDILKRSKVLDDYHWFGSVKEIGNIFKKNGLKYSSYYEYKNKHYEILKNKNKLFRLLLKISFLKTLYMNIILSGVAIKD